MPRADPRPWRTYKLPEDVAVEFERALWIAQASGDASNRIEAIEALAGEYLATKLHAFYHDAAARAARSDYAITQFEAFNDAGWRCLLCSTSRHLQTHHITPKSAGGLDELENLAVLCAACHAKITNPGGPEWHWRAIAPKLRDLMRERGRNG